MPVSLPVRVRVVVRRVEGEPASARFDEFRNATIREARARTGIALSWTYAVDNGFRTWRLVCGIGAEYYAALPDKIAPNCAAHVNGGMVG